MGPALNLWWAGPDIGRDYRPEMLRPADMARSGKGRAPRAERDWRVSRALLHAAGMGSGAGGPHAAPAPSVSLSHTRGHAVVATAPAAWRVGVDMEAARPRDVQRLASWCCSDDERQTLERLDPARALSFFYVLWTLKEGFVKAAGLDFPAHLRLVGLTADAGADSEEGAGAFAAAAGDEVAGVGADPFAAAAAGPDRRLRWRLRAPDAGWRAYSALLDGVWRVSAVWWAPPRAAGGAAHPSWRFPPGTSVPHITSELYWS